jgi:hypothetical protein
MWNVQPLFVIHVHAALFAITTLADVFYQSNAIPLAVPHAELEPFLLLKNVVLLANLHALQK